MTEKVEIEYDLDGTAVKVSTATPLPVDVQGAELTADLTTVNANTSRLVSGTTPLAPGVATATTALNIGGQYDSTQKTLSNGQQASYAMSARGAMIVTAGAEVLNVVQKGLGYTSKVDVTRQADTIAYDALDWVGPAAAAMTFTNAGFAGEMIVQSASIRFDLGSVPAGMGAFKLFLFSATPPSAPVDNAGASISAGDGAVLLGVVDFDTPADLGSILYTQAKDIGLQVTLATSSIHGALMTVAGWTPASEGTWTVTLHTRSV